MNPSKNPPADDIPLCVPEIRGREWEYVKQCLDTGWVSSVGSFVDRFEQEMARHVGAKSAVATVNGTAALHTALQIAGVERDDEVLVSTLTFIAPANAIRYVGAWPVFIDADPTYWQMDAVKVAAFLEQDCTWDGITLRNRSTGRRVKAIVPVHVLGHPVDLANILDVARRFGLAVIEDATESLGARYRGTRVGTLGDIACFSFNGNKLLTTGGGGMIVTNNEAWAARAKYLTTQAKDDPVEYVHHEIGYNYRLTNLQAAMGCAQLEQIDDYISAKRGIAGRYAAAFSNLPGVSVMAEAPWAFSVFWMFTILIDSKTAGVDSRELLRALAAQKIQTRPLWQPLHLSRAHAGAVSVRCETAERLHRDALSLPCSVGLTLAQQERAIGAVRQILGHAAR